MYQLEYLLHMHKIRHGYIKPPKPKKVNAFFTKNMNNTAVFCDEKQ